MSRLPVKKTYKLFVGGEFPRSESGRTYEAEGQNVARGSRKDLRDAVRAARGAFPKWAGMTAYNRGQVLYRVAEMMEARQGEFVDLCSGPKEVERSIELSASPIRDAEKLVTGAVVLLHDVTELRGLGGEAPALGRADELVLVPQPAVQDLILITAEHHRG